MLAGLPGDSGCLQLMAIICGSVALSEFIRLVLKGRFLPFLLMSLASLIWFFFDSLAFTEDFKRLLLTALISASAVSLSILRRPDKKKAESGTLPKQDPVVDDNWRPPF
ncbi:MAG: hypothetical protein Kow00107_08070 [Planctomycetota bacterium]